MEIILNDYCKSLFNTLNYSEKKIFNKEFKKEFKKINKNLNLEKNNKIKIIIGAPAVGKTIYINNLKMNFNNFYILESDDFRKHLKSKFKLNIEDYGVVTNNYCFLFFDLIFDFLIKNNFNLICSFSFTNSYIWFFDFIKNLIKLNYKIEIFILEKDINFLLENNDKRYEEEFILNGFGRKVEKEKIIKSVENIELLKKELSNNDIDFLII